MDHINTNPSTPESDPRTARPRRYVLRNTAFMVLGRVQGAVFSYAVIRILLKALTIEQYGLHSLLFVGVMIYMPVLFQFGMPNILQRFIPQHYSESRFDLIRSLFGTIIRTQLGTGIVFGVLILILAPRIAVWINYPDYADAIRIFVIGALFYLLSALFEILFGAVFRQRTVFWVMLVYNSVRLAVLYTIIQVDGTFMAVVISEVSVLAIMLILYAFAYSRLIPETTTPTTSDRPAAAVYRKYGFLSYANEIGASLLSVATDLLLVSSISGGLAAGYYALANRINHLVVRVLPDHVLAPVTRPLFFSEYGGSRESAGFGFSLLTKVTLLISLCVGLWLALMARPVIVHLFDPRYEDAAKLVTVMALFIPVNSMRLPLGIMLQNSQRVDLLIWAKITAVFKIAIGIWLLPRYGVMAMVWITGLAVLSQNLILYYFILTRLGHCGDPLGIIRISLNGVIAAVIFFFARPFFDSTVGVILSAGVFFLIYLAVGVLHKSFRPEERDFLNKHLPRPLWYF